MDNLHLVTGFLGREHITAADQGAFNAALIGTGQFVLEKGKVFEAQVISNNLIRVLDGELMIQGRFIRLNPETYVELAIENGEKGLKRNDLIAVRYTKDTLSGIESVNLVVIKGEAVEGEPVDPAITEGDITNGEAILHEFPLWRIPIDGLNVGEPVALYGLPFIDSMQTLHTIREDLTAQMAEFSEETERRIGEIESYTKVDTLSPSTKTALGLSEDAVPDDAFRALKNWLPLAEYNEAGAYTFTVPEDVDELGILVLGGGGSGGVACNTNSSSSISEATGGGSGEIAQFVLKKANGDFEAGANLEVVVGAGGASASTTRGSGSAGVAGGSSSFAGVSVEGGGCGYAKVHSDTSSGSNLPSSLGKGQPSDAIPYAQTLYTRVSENPAPYGLTVYVSATSSSGITISNVRDTSVKAINLFDCGDTHIYCGAGGAAYCSTNATYRASQPTFKRAKGKAGEGKYGVSKENVTGNDATAPGDGGGGVAWGCSYNDYTYASGAGADGLVLVYGRRI